MDCRWDKPAGPALLIRLLRQTLTIARGASIGPAMMMIAQDTLLRRRAKAPARA
jgi:hypothetical protein